MRHIGTSLGIADRPRQFCLRKSRDDLAILSGSNRNDIGEIKRGEKSPSSHIVFALAVGLRVPVSAIVKMAEVQEMSELPCEDRTIRTKKSSVVG